MSELNPSQRELAETLEGMVVVDAGPGTGKTHTIVRRYINIVSRDDVKSEDVLLMTFTNNAAAEMDDRIKGELAEMAASLDRDDPEQRRRMEDIQSKSALVRAQTFDAFCLSVVMDSPEQAGRLFGLGVTLTRGAAVVQNDSMNREWFRVFFDDFLARRGDDYGKWAALSCECPEQLLGLINRLMSLGVYPLREGWFGVDWERKLLGDPEALLDRMRELNEPSAKGIWKAIEDYDEGNSAQLPPIADGVIDDAALADAAREDRGGLVRFIHDVYHEYVAKSMESDRLTFGITAMLALGILYEDRGVRERNSFSYVMIDEFQDTNANQLMIALMILRKPNLCVVGDWKQGIYGFRFVSIDNILNFEARLVELRRFLNEDLERVPFRIPEVRALALDVNYRSSERVVGGAFEALYVPGSREEVLDEARLDSIVKRLTAGRTDIGDLTAVRLARGRSKDDEASLVARCVRDYMSPGRYPVAEKDPETGDTVLRPMRYGDIAIMCRTTDGCIRVLERLQEEGVPAFLQGEVDLMSTREGKLTLAWLRFVNNIKDPWGYVPVMIDYGCSMRLCKEARSDIRNIPLPLRELRKEMYAKRRRVTSMLTCMFRFYGLDNDRTQAVISLLSGIHRETLSTISDLITMIEGDISRGSKYTVENSIDEDAVTILTMHKAKGLEFPATVIPYVDRSVLPLVSHDRHRFVYSPLIGIRCTMDLHDYGGYLKEVRSWRTALVRKADPTGYDEERRLLFVAMSRAKQYETLICGDKPSSFMKGLQDRGLGEFEGIPDGEEPPASEEASEANRPAVPPYAGRRPRYGVHEFMSFNIGVDPGIQVGEVPAKGREYGTAVHELAYRMFMGWRVTDDDMERYPELSAVSDVLAGARAGGRECMAEVDCVLPLEDPDLVLRGRIDLLSVGDRIEVHDYKTDASDIFGDEYRFQLSVYAHAVSGSLEEHAGKPVVCVIDYLSLGRSVEFEPMGLDEVSRRVRERLPDAELRGTR